MNQETIQARRQRASLVPRACEGCKIRKIRCDRSNPCSNCQTAGIACQKINARPEIRPKPDKIADLEEHIERLEQRLGVVEDQLANQNNGSAHPPITPIPDETMKDQTLGQSQLAPSALFEGSSSFTNESIQASEVALRTANSDGATNEPDLNASLNQLKSLLQVSATFSSFEDHHFSKNQSSRMMPTMAPLPLEFVVALMREIKKNVPMFMTAGMVNDPSFIEWLCRKTYFPTEPISLGHLTGTYGALYFILKEFITSNNPFGKDHDIKMYASTCEENFIAGIETYEVVAVPSFENLFALIMGIVKALDRGKSLLSCTLIPIATSHCKILGYHREVTYQKNKIENAEVIRRLFWTLYILDKNMSLLLGRSSCMLDFDIDVQYPPLSDDIPTRSWDLFFVMSIKLSKIQAQIYDKLYSVTGLKLAVSERARHIDELDVALQNWRSELDQIDSSQTKHHSMFVVAMGHWDIMYYSCLTSVLRAASVSEAGAEISSRCFQAARLCLQSHLRVYPTYRTSAFLTDSDYVNWVLHYASLTPFVIVFLHAIAATSLEDIKLLDDVVSLLQTVQGGSKGSRRLCEICATFARLAKGVVKARNSCLRTYNQQDDSLHFLNDGSLTPTSQPNYFQDLLGTDAMDYLTTSEANDMSTILGSWVNGQPSTMSLFGMSFGDGQN